MKVLLTGGGGFLGAWIARKLLQDGHNLRLLDLQPPQPIFIKILGEAVNRIDWVCADIRNGDAVKAAAIGCKTIIHLAGLLTTACKINPELGAQVNVIGTLNTFEAARENGIGQVLYTSSGGVYGPSDPATPCPTTLYGAFKLANEGSARAYWEDYGISSIGYRPFVIFGPGRETGLTAGPTLACRAAALGIEYTVPYVGSSGLIYVEDVADDFVRGVTAEFKGAHVINQPGDESSVEWIIRTIKDFVPASGKHFRIGDVMKVLLTGGGGFLGAWIARKLLQDGHNLRLLDLQPPQPIFIKILGEAVNRIDWVCADIRNGDAVKAAAIGCKTIIHLAGLLTTACKINPELGAQVNVIGTLNTFEAARENGIGQVLYTSSGGVYGPSDPATPCPTTLYGAFKLANEGSARAYWEDYGISSIGYRPFVIFGPGRETGLTAGPTLACRAAALGIEYTVPYVGSSGLIYVEDVADDFVRGVTAEFKGAHVINQPGDESSVEWIIRTIKDFVPAANISCSGDVMPSAASGEGYRGDDLIGQRSLTPLRAAVEKTIDFYREHAPQLSTA